MRVQTPNNQKTTGKKSMSMEPPHETNTNCEWSESNEPLPAFWEEGPQEDVREMLADSNALTRKSPKRKTEEATTTKASKNTIGNADHRDETPFGYTHEPINLAMLRDVASRRAADLVRLNGCSVTLRECIYYFLRCVHKHYGAAVGTIMVCWREASTIKDFGFETRRYSGCAPFLNQAKSTAHMDWMCKLIGDGVPKAFAGRSLFGMPKLLRHLARTGLDACDLDQVNSHFSAQLARHPAAKTLKNYVKNRPMILHEVAAAITPQPAWPKGWTSEGAAKELFLSLGYGGAISTWCEKYGVVHEAIPQVVRDFELEQQQLRNTDADKHPELLQRAKSAGKERPEVSLQAALNLKTERDRLDKIASMLGFQHVIASYEHDGLFIWRPPAYANRPSWQAELAERVSKELDVSLKAIPSKDELFDQLRSLSPGDAAAWDDVEDEWEKQLGMITQARWGASRGREDRLYAGIVALEPVAYPDYKRSVKALFKHEACGKYWFFNPKALQWEADTEVGRNELLHVISTVLSKRLSDFEAAFTEHEREVINHKSPPEVLNGTPLLERVEKMLRAPLRDKSFELDGEDTRRYLQFTNCVFDRDTMSFVQNSPEIRVTNCTEWAWDGSGLSLETEKGIIAALEQVARDEARGFDTLPEETCELLEALLERVPDIDYAKSVCGTWERAIYCLKHIARATFALKYQDILWSRGPGGNGKDVLANRVATLLGSYFVNLACEALTNCRDLDSPSQTILGLRSKRFVCVREIAKDATIRGHIYRTISDPKNKMKARGLYGKDKVFHPHYLLFACTNVPIEIDDKGGGSQRRTRILDMPFNFVDEPIAPNERKKDANIEDGFERNNPGFFFLLMQVFKILMSKPANHVTPVPDEVADAGAEELEEPWEEHLREFVDKHMEPTEKVALANTAAEVRDAFFKFACGSAKQREVRLKLARKGFHETTQAIRASMKRTTKRVYQYAFGGTDASFVRLRADCT